MSDHVFRAGTTDGFGALGSRTALRIGVLIGWATVVASLRDPAHRRIGTMWLALVVAGGAFGWLVAGPRGAITGVVSGFVGYFLLIMLLNMIFEPLMFRRASRVWFIDHAGRHGCAKAALKGDGTWWLSSVAAWPLGHGIGTELTEAITTDADRSKRTIQLTAENRQVGTLYRRFGFTSARPGSRAMRREPTEAAAPTRS